MDADETLESATLHHMERLSRLFIGTKLEKESFRSSVKASPSFAGQPNSTSTPGTKISKKRKKKTRLAAYRSESQVMISPKQALRKQLRALLEAMTPESKLAKSKQLMRYLLCSDLYRNSQSICTYLSLPNEPATDELIQHALQTHRQVFVPYVIPTDIGRGFPPELRAVGMVMRRLFSLEEVASWPKNQWGITEPPPPSVFEDDILTTAGMELLVVPGLGFSRNGSRIGRGGGYYDRYVQWYRDQSKFRNLKEFRSVAVAFESQIVERDQIPTEYHDITVDHVFIA